MWTRNKSEKRQQNDRKKTSASEPNVTEWGSVVGAKGERYLLALGTVAFDKVVAHFGLVRHVDVAVGAVVVVADSPQEVGAHGHLQRGREAERGGLRQPPGEALSVQVTRAPSTPGTLNCSNTSTCFDLSFVFFFCFYHNP